MKFKVTVTLLTLSLIAPVAHGQDQVAGEWVETYGKAQGFLEGRSDQARAESFLRMGKLAFRKKFNSEALAFFQKSKALDPNNLETHFALVHFEFSRGNFQRASRLLIDALDQHPDWAKTPHDPSTFFSSYAEFEEKFKALSTYTNTYSNNKDVIFLRSFYQFSLGHAAEALSFSNDKGLGDVEKIQPHVAEMRNHVELTKVSNPIVQAAVIQTVPTLAELSASMGTGDGYQNAVYIPSNSLNKNLQVWGSTIDAIANKYDVDPRLVAAVIHHESRFNPMAVSHANARGMMQLIPGTARRFGVERVHDPIENIEGGVRYLRYLLSLFKDVRLSVAAYNAGELNVIRYGGVPPFNETQDYVRKVLTTYRGLQ